MDWIDVQESLINPQATYSFDFIFNEHFSRNVHMHKFEYDTYISTFLFGLFSFLSCKASAYSEFEAPYFFQMFQDSRAKNQTKWIIAVKWGSRFEVHFVDFYYGENFVQPDRHIARQLYNEVVDEIIRFGTKAWTPSDGIFIHSYYIYALYGTSDTMQLIAKKTAPQVVLLVDDDLSREWAHYTTPPHCSFEHYFLYKSPSQIGNNADYLLEIANGRLNILGKSLYDGMDPSSAVGFFHGYYFPRYSDSFPHIFIHHHRHYNIDWFYLTSINPTPGHINHPFTLSFISYVQKSNYIREKIDHSTYCFSQTRPKLTRYTYSSEPADRCKIEYSSSLYTNELDLVSNILQYSSNITQEKLDTKELPKYITHILEELRPSYEKQSKTTQNYLKYFLMGAFISTEQKSHRCFVTTHMDILIFQPVAPLYSLILISLNNADYRKVRIEDLDLNATDIPENFLLIKIDETTTGGTSSLSREFLSRNLKVTLQPVDILFKKGHVGIEWVRLQKSHLLSKMLNISQSYHKPAFEEMTKIMTIVFPLLYVDQRNNFEPFMNGLFWRAQVVHLEQGTFETSVSQWTCKVKVTSNFLYYLERTFYFYFLPSIDAAITFLYSHKDIGKSDTHHVTMIYDTKAHSLEYMHHRDINQSRVFSNIGKTICRIYSDIDLSLCRSSSRRKRLLSNLLPQSSSLVPTALARHLEVIDKLSQVESEDPTSLKTDDVNRYKRGAGKKKNPLKILEETFELGEHFKGAADNTVKGAKNSSAEVFSKAVNNYVGLTLALKDKSRRVKRALGPIKGGFDIYNLKGDIEELINNTIATVKEPSAGAILSLTKDYTKMASTLFQGGVKVLKVLNVISKGATFLGPIGAAVSAVSIACTIASTLYDVSSELIILSQTVKLTAWQVIVQAARIAGGYGLSKEFQMILSKKNERNEKNLTFALILNLTTQDWEFPNYEAYVSSYLCGNNHTCFGSIVELDRQQSIQYTDPRYYQNATAEDKKVEILCVDGNILSAGEAANAPMKISANATSSHFCHSAFALLNHNASLRIRRKALYDIGPHATVKALKDYQNHFRIMYDFILLEGGDNDDFFDFISYTQCGYIRGGGGSDTIKLGPFNYSMFDVIIREFSVTTRQLNPDKEAQCIWLESIERIIGQPEVTETVFVNCIFNMIALNGGIMGNPDKIYIPERVSCVDTVSIILSGHTRVENRALGGSYLYRVSNTHKGDIKLEIYADRLSTFIEKSHTILIDHLPISHFAGMKYENCSILTINDRSGYTFSLTINNAHELIQIIFKDGERAQFHNDSMEIVVNSNDVSLGSLMSKYGQISFSSGISIKFGSAALGMSIKLNNGTIKYNKEPPLPLKFLKVLPDRKGSTIQCPSGHTYAVLEAYERNVEDFYFNDTIVATFVARQKSHATEDRVSLMVDLTGLLENWDLFYENHTFTIKLEEMANSERFKATCIISLKDQFFEICSLYFDGFTKYNRYENIRFMAHWEYRIELKTSGFGSSEKFDGYFPFEGNVDDMGPEYEYTKLELIKVQRIFYHHPDYLLTLEPKNVDWNEELTFPDIYLTNFDIVKIENIAVMTSMRSHYDRDIFKASKSFFTIILKDFYISEKMQSLKLKFESGMEILASEFVNYATFSVTKFKQTVEEVERYLTKKDVDPVKQGGYDAHSWKEIIFDRK